MKKIADIVETLGQNVTEGYQSMENGIVNGYKKIEAGAVDGFHKITDPCVEVLFAKEGETANGAKMRLNKKER